MLAYRREGKGPPLLLIHGWGVRYTIWKNLAPHLRTHFTLIKIELPGLGGSPPIDPDQPYYPACARAIEELRRGLGIERWAVMAYSSGTRAAEAYVQQYPASVSRVTFLCPARLTELSSLGLRLAWWLDNTRPELTDWALSDWRLYGFVRALGFNGWRHTYASAWASEIRQQPIACLKRQMFELPNRGRAPFALPAVPTLFIWGSRDAIMARPRRAGPNHVSIAASHSAPLVAARDIAEVALPFLTRGEVVRGMSRWRRLRRAIALSASEREELNRLRALLRRERNQFLRLVRETRDGRLPSRPSISSTSASAALSSRRPRHPHPTRASGSHPHTADGVVLASGRPRDRAGHHTAPCLEPPIRRRRAPAGRYRRTAGRRSTRRQVPARSRWWL